MPFKADHLWTKGHPYGIKPHMDSGIFTLLLTDGTQGLERCVNRKVIKFFVQLFTLLNLEGTEIYVKTY